MADEETTIRPRGESRIKGQTGRGACGRNWGQVLRLMGCISMLSLGVICVVDIFDVISSFKLNVMCLDVFMIIFAIVGLFAELRNTECLAGMGYSIVRNMYFITTYPGRAGWYIFMGTCNLDPDFKWYRLVSGGFTTGTGLLIMLLLMCIRDLPRYEDEEKVKKGAKPKPKGRGAKGGKGSKQKNDDREMSDTDSYEEDKRRNEDLEAMYYGGQKNQERKQEKPQDYRLANPFEQGRPTAGSVATTVYKNGDAPAVASAVARGDNASAAATVTRSVVMGPAGTAPPQSHALYAEYEDDQDDKKDANDDSELEKMYAQMKGN